MISMASRDALVGFRFTAISKIYYGGLAVIITPYLTEPSIETTHLCIGCFHHNILKYIASSSWFNRWLLFFVNLLFICSI